MIESSSLECETRDRLHHLYVSHSLFLDNAAKKISKNLEMAEELVSDLYLYLLEKPNPNIWYSTSFNLHYCHLFLKSRFINKIKKKPNHKPISEAMNISEEEYDYDGDMEFNRSWETLLKEMDTMKRQPGFASAMIFEHYMFGDKTLDEVSKDIGVSISTTFTHVRKAKQTLRERVPNPFRKKE